MTPERLGELALWFDERGYAEAAAALGEYARVLSVLEQLRGGRWLTVYRYTEGAAAVLSWPGLDAMEVKATGSSPLAAILDLADRLEVAP